MNEDTHGGNEPQVGWQFHPDGAQSAASSATTPSAAPPQTPAMQPQVTSLSAPSAEEQEVLEGLQAAQTQISQGTLTPEATWQAAEFIVHEKSSLWYIGFVLAAFIITGAIFFITRDIFSLVTIIALFLLLGWMSVRRPRQVSYQILGDGLMINDHLHAYGTFKSFGVQDEGGVACLVFMPLKRFMLPLYVYYPPEDQDKIVDTLARHLPFTPVEQSTIDRLAHRLKF